VHEQTTRELGLEIEIRSEVGAAMVKLSAAGRTGDGRDLLRDGHRCNQRRVKSRLPTSGLVRLLVRNDSGVSQRVG
jgi:hypothetical protein